MKQAPHANEAINVEVVGRDGRRGQTGRGGRVQGAEHRAGAGIVAQGSRRGRPAPVRQHQGRTVGGAVDDYRRLTAQLSERNKVFQGTMAKAKRTPQGPQNSRAGVLPSANQDLRRRLAMRSTRLRRTQCR
jgi:hypothetical protein